MKSCMGFQIIKIYSAINKYKKIKELGKGASGIVYKVFLHKLNI